MAPELEAALRARIAELERRLECACGILEEGALVLCSECAEAHDLVRMRQHAEARAERAERELEAIGAAYWAFETADENDAAAKRWIELDKLLDQLPPARPAGDQGDEHK